MNICSGLIKLPSNFTLEQVSFDIAFRITPETLVLIIFEQLPLFTSGNKRAYMGHKVSALHYIF